MPREYPNQFTIRSRVASCAETELSKIVNGNGDWMFYGPSNAAQTGVKHWWPIDLKAFRAGLIRHVGNGHKVAMGDQANAEPPFAALCVKVCYGGQSAGDNRYRHCSGIISTTTLCDSSDLMKR